MNIKEFLSITLLVAGSGAAFGAGTLPYSQTFASNLGDMTVVNVEEGSPTFTFTSYYGKDWSGGAQYIGNADYKAEDYLLTPEFAVEAGNVYTVSLEYKGNTKVNVIKLVALVGGEYKDVTVATEVTENVWTPFSGRFVAAESGNVQFGVAILSPEGLGTVYFDNFAVSAGVSANAPAAVTDATATPTVVNDNFVVTLSAKTPAVNFGGEELSGTVDLSIVREDGVEVYNGKDLAPDVEVTATDNEPLTSATTYTFKVSNAAGAAPEVSAYSNPTFSMPKAVENLKAVKNGGEVTLTWDAVTEATSEGGVFIPSKVLYTVQRNGSSRVIIADKIAETQLVDNYTLPEEGQDAVTYSVFAVSFTRTSSATVSESLLLGNPYSGEYAESFAKYSYTTKTWTVEGGTSSVWQTTSSSYTPSCSPQDGDEGMLKVQNTGATSVWIASPLLNVSALKNPRIDFYVYQDNSLSYTNSVVPMVRVNGTDIVLGDEIAINGGTEKGWNKFSYYVPAEAKASDFQLVFNSIPGSYASVCIDNITVKDILDNDLALEALEVPANLNLGETVDLTAKLFNKGSQTAADYKVKFSIDGAELATVDGAELASENRTDAVLPFTVTPALAGKTVTFTAELLWEADENAADNLAEATAEVATNDYPVPQSLAASIDDNNAVTLTWQRPEISTEATTEEVSESFESWTTGATTAEDGWLYIDADGAPVRGINGVNADAPQAASVVENGSYNTAHSGTKMLGVSAPYSYRDTNDDWIISPELTGGQTVTFYVAGYSSFGYVYSDNYFTICYSTGGVTADSFIELQTININKKDWTETSFELPANATRFAIHVTKIGDAGILFDDFSFVKGSKPLELAGYNVYRDDVKLSATEADVTTFVDENAVDKAVYTVSAVYDRGESLASEPVEVTISSGTNDALATGIAVESVAGGIRFSGLTACAAIYNLAGQLVTSAVVADGTVVALQPGIYVVAVDNLRTKVVVK